MPRARLGQRAAACLVTAVLGLSACANPFASDPEVSDEPRDDLAQQAEGDVVDPPDATVAAPTTTSTTVAGSPAEASGSGPGGSTGSGGSAPRVIANVADPAGDADTLLDNSPDYADALQVAIETLGADARVTVRVASALPAALADGEVVGIGIDFFRSGGTESDYQLFADGGAAGWRAFLQTPEGFIEYPGSFAVSGTLVQFRVPWDALGGQPKGTVTAFLDWSARETIGLVTSTTDRAPDRGAVRLG